MTASLAEGTEVLLAPRRHRQAVQLGADSATAPKAGFTVSIGETAPSPTGDADITAERSSPEEGEKSTAAANAAHAMEQMAERALQRAHALPRSGAVWLHAGLASLAALRHEEARVALERALEINPDSAEAQLSLARTVFEQGEADRAIVLLQQLLDRSPSNVQAAVSLSLILVNLGRLGDALATLEKVEPNARTSPSFMATRGALRLAQGENLRGAIQDLRVATRERPDWIHARSALGIAELKVGNIRVAERLFRQVIHLAPWYPQGMPNLLRLLILERRNEEALALASERFAPREASPAVARLAGLAALALKRWRKAVDWMEPAVEKSEDPGLRARLLNDIGLAYSNLGRRDLAGEYFERSFNAAPLEAAIVNRATTYAEEGRNLEAIAWLRTAPVLEGGVSFKRREVMFIVLAQARLVDDAVREGNALLDDPEADADVYSTLSAVYTDEVGDPRKAVEIARRGLERFPENLKVLNNLAYALLMSDQPAEAERLLRAGTPEKLDSSNSAHMYLAATWGLLELKKGNIEEGRRWYEDGLGMAATRDQRARVKAKRDLELARALRSRSADMSEIARLLTNAAQTGKPAQPYSGHAEAELKRLRGSE